MGSSRRLRAPGLRRGQGQACLELGPSLSLPLRTLPRWPRLHCPLGSEAALDKLSAFAGPGPGCVALAVRFARVVTGSAVQLVINGMSSCRESQCYRSTCLGFGLARREPSHFSGAGQASGSRPPVRAAPACPAPAYRRGRLSPGGTGRQPGRSRM